MRPLRLLLLRRRRRRLLLLLLLRLRLQSRHAERLQRAFLEDLVKDILGQARIDQDLELLPSLGENILRGGAVVLRRRARLLRRHDGLLLLVLDKGLLLGSQKQLTLLVRTLTRIHNPLSPHLMGSTSVDEAKREKRGVTSERQSERTENECGVSLAWCCCLVRVRRLAVCVRASELASKGNEKKESMVGF